MKDDSTSFKDAGFSQGYEAYQNGAPSEYRSEGGNFYRKDAFGTWVTLGPGLWDLAEGYIQGFCRAQDDSHD